jgi:hypothetical protein
MPNSTDIKNFIKENSQLFWYIPEQEKQNISHEVLVEFVLNFGDLKAIKKLFKLLGINTVAEIFHKQISRQRINYHKRTVHFFDLYFRRHANKYPV